MPYSKFVGATGNGGEFFGDEITDAQARFEAWLSEQGWEDDEEGQTEAEGLITDYLAVAPRDDDHSTEILEHAWRIGKITDNEANTWRYTGD